jgi:hypothetical protein
MPQAPISGKTALIFSHSSSLVGMILLLLLSYSKAFYFVVGLLKRDVKEGKITQKACQNRLVRETALLRTNKKAIFTAEREVERRTILKF